MKSRLLVLACFCALNVGAQVALKLVQTIPLPDVSGRIDHFAMDAQNQRLFMAALGNDTVEVMDLKNGKHLQTLRGCSEPQGLGFTSNRLFVANGSSGELKIYDGETFQLLKTIGSLDDADNVRCDVTGRVVWVGYGGGALTAFDLSGAKTATVSLDGHPESFQLEQNGNRIFVNVPGDRSIAVIDRAQKKLVTKWRLESAHSNFPMALDEANQRLYVGCRSPARLLVLDTTSGKLITQIEIAGDTDDVFLDAKRQRLYVSCGEGFLDVIQRSADDHYERIAHQPTRGGARTSFYSPEDDRLFLAVPKRLGQPAEVRIYQPE